MLNSMLRFLNIMQSPAKLVYLALQCTNEYPSNHVQLQRTGMLVPKIVLFGSAVEKHRKEKTSLLVHLASFRSHEFSSIILHACGDSGFYRTIVRKITYPS